MKLKAGRAAVNLVAVVALCRPDYHLSVMKLTREGVPGSYRIRAYRPGSITINETEYGTGLLVTAETVDTGWPPDRFQDLTADHIHAALALEPELILLGTGATQRFPERAIMQAALQRGVGIEVMDTASACRTYNVLLAEDRRVVAALLP